MWTLPASFPDRLARGDRLGILRQLIDTLLADARPMGIDVAELKALIDDSFSAYQLPRDIGSGYEYSNIAQVCSAMP